MNCWFIHWVMFGTKAAWLNSSSYPVEIVSRGWVKSRKTSLRWALGWDLLIMEEQCRHLAPHVRPTAMCVPVTDPEHLRTCVWCGHVTGFFSPHLGWPVGVFAAAANNACANVEKWHKKTGLITCSHDWEIPELLLYVVHPDACRNM